MSNRFPKSCRIKKRHEFLAFNRHSRRVVGKWLTVDILDTSLENIRLGITASKHYGNACLRNRFKRLVREAFRLARPLLKGSCDVNVRPRPYAKQATSQNIQSELITLLS